MSRHCPCCSKTPQRNEVILRAEALYYAAESIYKGSPSWEKLDPAKKSYWISAAQETFSNALFFQKA